MIRVILKEFLKKQKRKRELRAMDAVWRIHGGGCFGGYPPSFYETHTQEEINEISNREIKRLKEICCEYEKRIQHAQ